jgi:hypothetical protein
MILSGKTSAYPTHVTLGRGNRVYIEVLPGDDESYMQQAAAFLEEAMKEITMLRKQKLNKKVECEPLRATHLDKL